MKNVALKYVTQNCYLFIQIRCFALYVLCFSGPLNFPQIHKNPQSNYHYYLAQSKRVIKFNFH